MMKIGSHVSNNGDLMLYGSVLEAVSYGANCFMVYLGGPQTTLRKDLSTYNVFKMHEELEKNNIKLEDVIIHAPYIVNLAQPDEEKRQFGVDFLTQELKRMKYVGAKYMVVHPGAHMKEGTDAGLERIAKSFNQILENTKGDDTYIAIETMAGKGTECCTNFNDIKKVMDLVGENSKRLVVCFDTCHTHDAGYDFIGDYEKVIKDFDEIIGLDKLKVIHLNDSKNELGSHKDRHENIGFGNIGFDALMKFVNDKRFENIPIILETPYVKDGDNYYSPYKYEISMIRANKFDPDLISKIVANKGL